MSDEREQRNAVFGGASPVQPGIPMISAVDKVKADFGLDIPSELVPLPSNGVVYPADSPLNNKEVVEIRPMTTREEDILMSRALLKKGTVITELLRSCLTDKSINPIDMLTGDRSALMVAIRITGYGPEYETELTCTECGEKFNYTFDLAALPIKRLEIVPVELNMNLFEFLLPKTKKRVQFRFLTGRDEEDITATAARQKKMQLGTENTVSTNIMHAIVSIEGVTDRAKIANFVRQMPAIDSLKLRNYIRDNEPGMVMKQDVSCTQCSATYEVSMPLGANFLWPGALG